MPSHDEAPRDPAHETSTTPRIAPPHHCHFRAQSLVSKRIRERASSPPQKQINSTACAPWAPTPRPLYFPTPTTRRSISPHAQIRAPRVKESPQWSTTLLPKGDPDQTFSASRRWFERSDEPQACAVIPCTPTIPPRSTYTTPKNIRCAPRLPMHAHHALRSH